MTGKVKVQPASSSGLAPLVEMAEQLRAAVPGWEDAARSSTRPPVISDLAHDLAHLARHDGDGLLIASIGDEVVGFASSCVRSRQLLLPQVWLLPEYLDQPVAETLIRKALAFGERSGAQDTGALVLGHASLAALLFRFGLRPRYPVFRLVLSRETAQRVGLDLSRLLPGHELTREAAKNRTGLADIDRLDRLARGVTRPMDHEYWLTTRELRLGTVREGQRIAAYAYGGAGQCGPVVASTGEAALAGLGWALQLAADSGGERVEVLVPAPFESGIEHLLDGGAQCRAVAQWMSRQPAGAADRLVLSSATLL
jgi:hypothetical protein